MFRRHLNWLWLLVLLIGAGMIAPAQNNQMIPFSGEAPGQPDGPIDLTFKLYDAAADGTYLGYTDAQSGVVIAGEAFSAVLGQGSGGPVPAAILAANPSVHIAIELTTAPGAEIARRVPIYSSGYAHSSQSATNAQTAITAQTAGSATTAQTFNPGAVVTGASPDSILRLNNTNPGGDIIQGGTNQTAPPVFRVFGNGGAFFESNVGIGTADPLGKLQVVTANDATPNTVHRWDNRHFVIGAPSSAGGVGISYNRTNNYGIINVLSPDVAWRNLVLQSGGGNVGIGTTAPRGRLEVAGNGASVVMGDPNCGPGSNTVAIGFLSGVGLDCGNNFNFGASTTGRETVINRPFGGAISFREGNQPDQMHISPGGNVGIGTSNPTAKMHVISNGTAAFGKSTSGQQDAGVFGLSTAVDGNGVIGEAHSGGSAYAIWGRSSSGFAGWFDGKVQVNGNLAARVVQITGADFSEKFDVRNTQRPIEPGMVVAIDSENPGKLVVTEQAYNRRVAGIISGAGGINTGMLMGQPGTMADGDQPVALSGRVYVWADASNGAIVPGDLLTTSNVVGHAMKVTNYAKAQGATLGKAMTGLSKGRGLVLVLVTLQ